MHRTVGDIISSREIGHADGVAAEEVVIRRGAVTRTKLRIRKADYAQILALTPDNLVVVVRQYKIGGGVVSELPAGHLKRGESPSVCARRELAEETGYEVSTLLPVFAAYSSPGILTNRAFGFIGYNARRVGAPQLEPDEAIEVLLLPLNEVVDRIRSFSWPTDLGTVALVHAVVGNFANV